MSFKTHIYLQVYLTPHILEGNLKMCHRTQQLLQIVIKNKLVVWSYGYGNYEK